MAATEAERLVEAADAHFAWMLGKDTGPGLRLPPGGVDSAETLELLRRMTRRLHMGASRGSWLIVSGDEVVGLCSYKEVPRNGVVEIGYGIAQSRRNRGHATRAVARLKEQAMHDPAVTALTASTAAANVASQRVLDRNGFVRTATSNDPEDGPLIWWRLDLG